MPSDAVVVRRYSRPDQPQPNYRGALGIAKLWEGWLQVAANDAQRNCGYRTDARAKLDVRSHEWAPSFAWNERVVEAVVAQWEPNWASPRLGERTPDGKRLDVRTYEWAPVDGWRPKVVDGVVAQWIPIFDAELGYRSLAGPTLDVRRHDWAPVFSWPQRVVDGLLAQWRPAIDAAVSFRTVAGPLVDVRRVDVPIFDWTQPVIDAVVQQWAPIWLAESLGARTAAGRVLNLRDWAAQDGWIFTNLPSAVSQAQLWPAILAALGLSYRSGDRAILDVRSVVAPIFDWTQPVIDATVQQWTPIFQAEGLSFRTVDGRRLDVRDWAALFDWITTNLPPAVTVAQAWPAILQALGLSYRSLDRPVLDVRGVVAPIFSWPQPVVDGTVRLWTPNWTAERTGSGRTAERRRFDVRDQPWFSSWVTTGDPVVVASGRGPAIILVNGRLAMRLSDFIYEWIA